ncbi:universal stress protein [Fundidesulfovibrio agrisoli]|uniref:universal stress protein n=1 Tax=Fundidesulfovibrio agrisoli TaxID=2922717 RepID=UPI001FADBD1B|nr:universal stress protein [Fundidesulfovibrio agrisoli]
MEVLEKHLLVSISEDVNAFFGLRYVFGFFTRRDLVRLTLFYVGPRHPQPGLENLPYCSLDETQSFGGGCRPVPQALHTARNWLLDMGFPAERIELKAFPAKLGTVKDIATEAERGMYDAVVLGRRGLSWFDEMFDDSVSHRLLWESISFPLWVCRNPVRNRRNVLLCVDGSEQSLRVADHVGFVLRDEPEHSVTVLHNRASTPVGNRSIESVMAEAGELLRENGLEEERISYLVKSSKHPADMILEEARKGEYAAVAIGRTGGKPGAFSNIFGSLSQTLLRKLEGAALWVSK